MAKARLRRHVSDTEFVAPPMDATLDGNRATKWISMGIASPNHLSVNLRFRFSPRHDNISADNVTECGAGENFGGEMRSQGNA